MSRVKIVKTDNESIKSLLKQTGLTRKEIASKLGITEAAIGWWAYTGRIRPIYLRILHELTKSSQSKTAIVCPCCKTPFEIELKAG